MKIYIQSCGVLPEDDYCWIEVSASSQQRILQPPLLQHINNLIQKEAPSIVLARHGSELLLLISNLEASERVDYVLRKARNSIMLVGQNTDESVLRTLAVRALREQAQLTKEIDRAVLESSNRTGFEVSFKAIHRLTEKSISIQFPPDEIRKIGRNTEKLRHQLADELTQHCLPQREGSLVVVTRNKEESILKQAKVWRALSALIDTEDWQEVSEGIFSINKYSLLIGIGITGGAILLTKLGLYSLTSIFSSPPGPNLPIVGRKVNCTCIKAKCDWFSKTYQRERVVVVKTISRDKQANGWTFTIEDPDRQQTTIQTYTNRNTGETRAKISPSKGVEKDRMINSLQQSGVSGLGAGKDWQCK